MFSDVKATKALSGEQLKKKHQEEISENNLQRSDNLRKIIKLLEKQEKEMKNVKDEKQNKTHEKELSDLIEELLNKVNSQNRG